jgi:hypothetical protein
MPCDKTEKTEHVPDRLVNSSVHIGVLRMAAAETPDPHRNGSVRGVAEDSGKLRHARINIKN